MTMWQCVQEAGGWRGSNVVPMHSKGAIWASDSVLALKLTLEGLRSPVCTLGGLTELVAVGRLLGCAKGTFLTSPANRITRINRGYFGVHPGEMRAYSYVIRQPFHRGGGGGGDGCVVIFPKII